MKIATLTAVGVLLGMSVPSSALTLEIEISGPAQMAYELTVGGVSKNGRLADREGRVNSREAVDVTPRAESLPASLTFYGEHGPVAVCPAVKILIEGKTASCKPSFTMVADGSAQTPTCRATCERPKRHEEESDETYVAMERN